jgi:ribose 5-phosphate isomerase B
MITLYIGADHAGWRLKEKLKSVLNKMKVRMHDLTPAFKKDDDYPAIGKKIAQRTAAQKNSMGVLVCGSGVGMAIAANRVKGARAVEGYAPHQVKLAREHNNANILTIGERQTSAAAAAKLLNVFLTTTASRESRHVRRVKQLG